MTDGVLEILAGGEVKDPGNPGGRGVELKKSSAEVIFGPPELRYNLRKKSLGHLFNPTQEEITGKGYLTNLKQMAFCDHT